MCNNPAKRVKICCNFAEKYIESKVEANENRSFARFLADSGATEHLTNSKLIFKTFDKNDSRIIQCANKDSSADLKTEGAGDVEVVTNDGKYINLENVICAESLSENLFSLRKFAGMGFTIYLDNEKINIFDPVSKESFITGIYKRPYWLIEFEIDLERFER